MCDLGHRKLMRVGREKEPEKNFTEILFSTFRQGGGRGRQWNEFPRFALICLRSNTVQPE